MILTPGVRLGSYEILSPLGAGGMGEVYRALDSRLGRQVAIKVLPEGFASDADRLARLQREAQLLATLNHPNIAAIYHLDESEGARFLVLELVDGQTLADMVRRGPVPLDDTIAIARQIAEAIEAAHDKGIVHRDLKPANVKITPDGTVKVLDFGLAKFSEELAPPATLSLSPTRTTPGTMQGVILGTAAYMSPEQARGKDVDRRSDIWSFGCVVYELLTGRQAFEGETVTDLFASVLKGEPDWTALPTATPDPLRLLLKRCLQKDLRRRLQHIGEARIALEEAPSFQPAPAPPATAPVTTPPRRPTLWMVSTACLLLAVIGLVAAGLVFYRSLEAPRAVQFLITPPEKTVFQSGDSSNFALPSLSPDGRHIAFTARDQSGRAMLWVRSLDVITPRLLSGTDGASRPFWSPDSRAIAFFADGRLKRIDATGGPVQSICDAGLARGGTWNRDGVILFAPGTNVPISRVSAAGGQPVPATRLVEGQFGHRAPSFLPDGRHFLYYALSTNRGDEPSVIYVGTLDSLDVRRLAASDSNAMYAPSGDLLFIRQGNLLRQPFDLDKLVLHGDPTPVAEQIGAGGNQGEFSVSENGVLAYKKSGLFFDVQLAWVDRSGKVLETVGQPGAYRGIDVSPDGTRIAVHRHEGSGGDIWLFEPSKTMPRLTFNPSQDNSNPIWSPDGKRLVFASRRNSKWGIYVMPTDGTGGEKLLYESTLLTIPMAWSPSGDAIVFFLNDPKTSGDEWLLPLSGDRKPVAVIQGPGNEDAAQISSDGKWIAYRSNESGRPEVYVSAFPSGQGKRQVSRAGGGFPRWRRDGKELFFNAQGKILAVSVDSAGSAINLGNPIELFDSGDVATNHTGPFANYAIAPDGQKFLLPRPVNAEDIISSTAITVIVNWTASLKH